MHHDDGSEQARKQLLDMQTALFNLRDGLMSLSMSLRDLACLTDEHGQQQACTETEQLLSRLRG